MIDFLVGLTESEINFWLEVSKGALLRTQTEIDILSNKKYKKRMKKPLPEKERKQLLAEKRRSSGLQK